MHARNCNLMTQDGSYFDITHTFKVGSSTYHVLGLRKDRPTYRNTYYIFNCSTTEHQSTGDSRSKSPSYKHSTRISEQASRSKDRSVTADDLPTNQKPKTKSTTSHARARTESPNKVEIDTTIMKDTFTKAMKTERQLIIASLRKEINMKKKVLLRSIKKEKKVLLQATTEANKKEEIIRLLEEQNSSLTNAYENYVHATTSSINSLKQTLIETLDTQRNTSQTTEQLQLSLIQKIEQEVQNIALKNEEILQSTAVETTAISQLQETLVEKIDNYSTRNDYTNDETLSRLFAEQNQALTDAVVQQQQTYPLDLIKRTMLAAQSEQQTASVNDTNRSTQQPLVSDTTVHNLPRITSSQRSRSVQKSTDQHLFKVSIRTPEPAHLYAKLIIDGIECSRRLHTLCQRDMIQNDVINCYIAPPIKNGPYEVTIYAKTNKENTYRAAICIRLPGSNISQSITFPILHQAFEEHQCILIEPFRRLLRRNEQVLIHMIVPDALMVKIRNGDDNIELDTNDYRNEVVKKKIRVRGDIHVIGCWDKKIESIICVFNVM